VPGRALIHAYRRHCFAWLFASLLLTLGTGFTLETVVPWYNPLEILLAVNLLAAIAIVAREGQLRLPLLIGGTFLGARLLRASFGLPGMLPLSQGVWFVAIAVATAAAARHALASGKTDGERLFAALDAYLLAGLLFAVAYWAIDQVLPGSFRGVTGELSQRDAIYFSFITISTLGYGDISPLSEPARGMAVVEAVSGQMYLAVLVARLVSLYSREHQS
jgi:hypothetical protein